MLQEIFSLLLSVVTAVLQVVGVISGEWWTVTNEMTNGSKLVTSFGIWKTYVCIDSHCVEKNRELSGELAWLLGVAVIETISAVLCFLVTGIAAYSLVRKYKNHDNTILQKLYVVFLGGAGAVIILGVLLFVKKKAGLTTGQAVQTKDGQSSWSLALSSSAGGIGILAAVTMGMTLLCRRDFDDDEDDEKGRNYWTNKLRELDDIATIKVGSNNTATKM